MILQFTGEDKRGWDELILELSLAVNSRVPDTIVYSAAYLVQAKNHGFQGHWNEMK